LKLERLPLLEAGKITSPGSWKDYLSLKLEGLPLLEAGRLPLLEAGRITSPGSMEGVSRRYPLYLSREPGAGQHFLVVVDLLHGIPTRTIVNAFLRSLILR
jgi:hypothetical protein